MRYLASPVQMILNPIILYLGASRWRRMMQQILPGIFHWTQKHPKIRIEVSSYYLEPERTLIDPLIPAEGLEWFAARPPEHIVLTMRHHYRHCGEFGERFGCDVWCVEQGLHEFEHGEVVRGFRFGDTLPGGLKSIEIGHLCPDEGCLYLEREDGVLFIGDGCVRRGDAPLQFVPDQMLGDDPEGVKAGLAAAYRRVIDEYQFAHVMLAHGLPLPNDGRRKLAEFIDN